MASYTIAIDVMGGDFGPHIIIPSTLDFLRKQKDVSVCFVGNQNHIRALLINQPFADRITIVHSEQVIAMNEAPIQALRQKKRSSTHLTVEQVKQGLADACISAGNTGALMAISKYKLGMIKGIDRPAICGALPSLHGHSYLLDMGANVDCSAEHLLQFALMASVMVGQLKGIAAPTVALLNNGEEDVKGNSQVKQAAALLSQHPLLNYVGYIEGHHIFDAAADIIVCDGFVGNIALKASEGVASYITQKLRQEVQADFLSWVFSLFAWPALMRVKKAIDPRRFNGASLLGVQGVVVKSHGHADRQAFLHALQKTYRLMQSNMTQRLNQAFSTL